jgi:suppressor for copper-sensitivity B
LIAAAIWLGPVMRTVPKIRKATPVVLFLATIAAITTAEIGDINAPLDTATPGVSKIGWQKFDPAAIPRLVDKDLIVFVDVTADWCITCQVNKRFVLEQGRILELLNSPDVIAMQADWTRPDPEIAEYLASFGRYGIPFNAVYGAAAPNGVALPELLTDTSVLDGFRAAAPPRLAERFE